MASPSCEQIVDLLTFTEKVQNLTATGSPIWYRGTGKSSYPLSPSLFRHSSAATPDGANKLEEQIISRFKQRGLPFMTRALTDEWDHLFYMQHYGIPTRLLDWSENPYMALYFALTSAHATIVSGVRTYVDPAAVWVLNPVQWNQHALRGISYTDGILSLPDAELDKYAPGKQLRHRPNAPLAIFGTHNSARIVAQRGVFTIFGKGLSPLETLYDSDGFPPSSLMKLEIPATHIAGLLKAITSSGYTDSVAYPDMEGFAKELKRFFDFGV